MEIKKGDYLKDNFSGFCIKITNDGLKDGFIRGIGYKGKRNTILEMLENGTYSLIPTLVKNGKIAKLVSVSLKTRVVVSENASDEEIMELAIPQLCLKLKEEGVFDNLENIEDDLICPYETDIV